jgi:peptidoglycan/LPS O-acetylase OafA/YrhL
MSFEVATLATDQNQQPQPSTSPTLPPALWHNLHQKKIPKLDALRAISALIVVLYHFFNLALFPAGLGVMVFFVISGFLITWLLLDEFDTTQTISLTRFYFRRTFRIFPAFYVFWIVIVGGLLLKHGHLLWGQAIATFFYVGNYYQGLNGYPQTGLSHAWSLGVEEQYYLLWPALFRMFAAHRQRLLQVTCAAILLIWIYRIILQAAGASPQYIYTAFDTRADHLLIGCALAISLRYQYFARFFAFICARTAYMLVPLAGLVLSSAAWWRYGDAYRNAIAFVLDPVLITILMAQLLATRDRRLAWMDSPLLVYLGTISYSTYLYHKLAGELVDKSLAGRIPHALIVILGVAATYAVASVSYHLVEKPFLLLRDHIRRSRSAAPTRSPAPALVPEEVAPGCPACSPAQPIPALPPHRNAPATHFPSLNL